MCVHIVRWPRNMPSIFIYIKIISSLAIVEATADTRNNTIKILLPI